MNGIEKHTTETLCFGTWCICVFNTLTANPLVGPWECSDRNFCGCSSLLLLLLLLLWWWWWGWLILVLLLSFSFTRIVQQALIIYTAHWIQMKKKHGLHQIAFRSQIIVFEIFLFAHFFFRLTLFVPPSAQFTCLLHSFSFSVVNVVSHCLVLLRMNHFSWIRDILTTIFINAPSFSLTSSLISRLLTFHTTFLYRCQIM